MKIFGALSESGMEAHHSVSVATGSRSRPDCIVKGGFSEQSWLGSFAFPAPASTHLYCGRASAGKQRGKAKKGAGASLSNSSAGGGSSPSRQNEEEGNVLQDIATLFCNCEQLKAMVDSSLNSGVGPDVRNRVDHLLKRIGMLKQSAERAASVAGGRVPSQLVASLKGLQREHSSLGNIVRLATEGGPVIVEMDSNDQDEYSLAMAAQKGTLSMRYGADSIVGDMAQGPRNETSVEVLSGPKYVMSTPPNESSSNFAAVRAEIERRVMEQLVKKQVNQPIFRSGQDFTNGSESKSTNLQKVPSVNGQRKLDGKSEVDNGFLPEYNNGRMVEARQLDQSPMLDPMQSPDFKARQLDARMISLELHEQMVSKFEKDLVSLREQLSGVTEDLKQKEDTLVAVKEKLMSEQSKLSEKINELSKEIMRRSTAEDLKHALEKRLKQMEKDLKGTQNQVVSLGFELEKKERVLEDFQEEHKITKQDLQAGILSLNGKLSHIEKLYEGFNPQSVIADLGNVKGTLSALRKDQAYVQAQMVDWKENIGALERSVWSNDREIKELTSEIDSRVRKGEVNDGLKKVVDEVEKQSEHLQNSINFIGVEQEKNETVVGLLQEDWKTCRKELQGHIEAVESRLTSLETVQRDFNNVQGVLIELSNIKNRLTDLQEERKQEQALILEVQQQMVVLEGKGSDLLKRMSEEAETQKQILMDEVRTSVEEDVLTELSNIKNKLIDLQEEQKHEQAEAQQKMAVLEGKGSDLLKRMSEEAETQRKILMDEVRTSVEELLKASHVSPSYGIEDALSTEESDAMKIDVRHLGNLVNRGTSSSVPNSNVSRDPQHETTLHGGAQQVPDKRTASLEAFFSVMGQLIREELKRMDGTSTLSEQHMSGEPTQPLPLSGASHVHGSGGTHKDGEDHGNNSMRLLYDSSWNRAFVHYCADKLGWTEVPGVPMQEASRLKGKSWKEFRIKATRLEFVVTDGQGNWDCAPNGCNYVLEKPGVFELSGGVLKPASTV